ncbi:MAG: hypothetical protein GXO86_06230 [Chlorobi bacterium]|nr:hypothetical protein [Chlorobiota bacterium]
MNKRSIHSSKHPIIREQKMRMSNIEVVWGRCPDRLPKALWVSNLSSLTEER